MLAVQLWLLTFLPPLYRSIGRQKLSCTPCLAPESALHPLSRCTATKGAGPMIRAGPTSTSIPSSAASSTLSTRSSCQLPQPAPLRCSKEGEFVDWTAILMRRLCFIGSYSGASTIFGTMGVPAVSGQIFRAFQQVGYGPRKKLQGAEAKRGGLGCQQ